jgi:hypothetical protein
MQLFKWNQHLKGGCMWYEKCFLVVGLAALLISRAAADIIDPNYHTIERCVTIGNMDAFPDIVVVAGYRGPSSQELTRYVVKADSCLTKGYKFSSFYLFWVAKSYFESTGLNTLALKELLPSVSAKRMAVQGTAAPMGLLSTEIDPSGGTVPDSNTTIKETFVYNLQAAQASTNFLLYCTSKTTIDKNGLEHKETFNPVTPVVYVTQQQGSPVRIRAYLTRNWLSFTAGSSGDMAGELINCQGKAVRRFTRNVTGGYSYLVPCEGISAGIYLLRVTMVNETITIKLPVFY